MKQTALLITEKKSVMDEVERAYKKIQNELPFYIDFACCAGHLVELYSPEDYKEEWGYPIKESVLPIIPDKWKHKVTASKESYFDRIKKMLASKKYDVIINAGDAGREGQLIQETVYKELGITQPVLRFWADDTTESTIIKTLKNLRPNEDYKHLTEAAYLRSYADWLVGMNFSRAATLSLGTTVAIGRVMSPVLNMVVTREHEINNFTPIDYYEGIKVFKLESGQTYEGRLVNYMPPETIAKNRYAYLDKSLLDKTMKPLTEGYVSEKKTDQKILNAPHLYNLTDLQKACSRQLGYTPKKTLEVAQSLYEKKLLSYPRTESRFLTVASRQTVIDTMKMMSRISELAPYVVNAFSHQDHVKKVLCSKKYVNDSKVSDHPALIPTSELPDFETLSQDEKNVYMIVAKRLVAIFMPPYVTDDTVITTICGDKLFETKCSVLRQNGWKELFPELGTAADTITLPLIEEGNKVEVVDDKIESKQTTAPPRYTYDLLLHDMEFAGKKITAENMIEILKNCGGLGTPATRADIIDKLIKKTYLSQKGKTLYPTDKGAKLIAALDGYDVISPELTAKLEDAFRQVENGSLDCDAAYDDVCSYVRNQTSSLLSLDAGITFSVSLGKCPLCKKQDVLYTDGWKYAVCKSVIDESDKEEKSCSFILPRYYATDGFSYDEMKILLSGGSTKPKTHTWNSGKSIFCSFKLDVSGKLKSELVPVGKCPKCGRSVVRGVRSYYCEGATTRNEDGSTICDFSIYNKIGKTLIKPETISELLEKGVTSKAYTIHWDDSRQSSCLLKLEGNSIKAFYPDPVEIMDCPLCGNGRILDSGNQYRCTHLPPKGNCTFKVYKTFFGAEITAKDLEALVTGKKLEKKLTFRNGVSNMKKIYCATDKETGKMQVLYE